MGAKLAKLWSAVILSIAVAIRAFWAEIRMLGSETVRRHPGKIGGIATILGLASDVGSPWQSFLTWLALAAAVICGGALLVRWLCWRAEGASGWPGRLRNISTSTAASSFICLIVFAVLLQAQRVFGGPGGLVAEHVPAVAAFQEQMTARFDRLDDALAVLEGEMAATRKGVEALNETAESTRQGVDALNETATATQAGVEALNETATATHQEITVLNERTGQTQAGVETLNQQMEFSVALSIIDRVRDTRDGSNQGQARAFAALLAEGYDFLGADFSGVSFRGADLSGADFSESVLHFADFRGARLHQVKAAKSGLRLALADADSDFSGADLSGIYAPLLDAAGANFEGARLRGANVYGANLRGARMAGADLSGGAFAFADLRDADLRGADLTGAHFVGTLLTGALLDDAVFGQTNMLAAMRDASTLTPEQQAGTCRHQASLQYGYGRLEMVERWESSKYSSGYEYGSLNEYDAGFATPGFDDLSLPVCASDAGSAVGFNAAYPFDEKFRLERSYLDKAGRRKKAIARFDAFRDRLEDGQAAGTLFRGTSQYRAEWIAFMTHASTRTDPVGSPFPDGDFLLPFLLRHGIVTPDQVDWRAAFQTRYYLENALKHSYGGDFQAHTYWQAFLPESAGLDDMPPEAEALFRDWTVARARLDYPELVLRPPLRVEVQADGSSVGTISQHFYRKTLAGLNFQSQSWPSGSAAKAVEAYLGGRERFVESPALRNAFGLRKLFYVFPEPLPRYRIGLPQAASGTASAGVPVELTVAVNDIRRLPDFPDFVAVYVTPVSAALTTPGTAPVPLDLSTDG